jgi:hypothetical protein
MPEFAGNLRLKFPLFAEDDKSIFLLYGYPGGYNIFYSNRFKMSLEKIVPAQIY